jgi:hypothetical protein
VSLFNIEPEASGWPAVGSSPGSVARVFDSCLGEGRAVLAQYTALRIGEPPNKSMKDDREAVMKRAPRQGVLLGLWVLTASVAVAAPPTRLNTAHDLAVAHAAWPPGRSWLDANKAKTGQLMIPVLNRCLPKSPEDELTAFSIYLRVSQKGRILEVVTDIDAALGRCMTSEAREVQLPEAPREDFWVQVNLAAGL